MISAGIGLRCNYSGRMRSPDRRTDRNAESHAIGRRYLPAEAGHVTPIQSTQSESDSILLIRDGSFLCLGNLLEKFICPFSFIFLGCGNDLRKDFHQSC